MHTRRAAGQVTTAAMRVRRNLLADVDEDPAIVARMRRHLAFALVATTACGGGAAPASAPTPAAPPPTPPTSSTDAPRNGTLSAPVIQRVVRAGFDRFRICYEDGLRRNPRLQGRVLVSFVIGRTGEVETTADAGSDIPDPQVTRCVVAGFRELTFPPPEGDGPVSVVYPIIFNPAPTNADAGSQ